VNAVILVLAAVLTITCALPAKALVLCVKKDPSSDGPKIGSVIRVRDACKTKKNGAAKEIELSASDLGVDLTGLPTVALRAPIRFPSSLYLTSCH